MTSMKRDSGRKVKAWAVAGNDGVIIESGHGDKHRLSIFRAKEDAVKMKSVAESWMLFKVIIHILPAKGKKVKKTNH